MMANKPDSPHGPIVGKRKIRNRAPNSIDTGLANKNAMKIAMEEANM